MPSTISKKNRKFQKPERRIFKRENPLLGRKLSTLDEVIQSLYSRRTGEIPIKFRVIVSEAIDIYLQSNSVLTSRKLFESLARNKNIPSPTSLEYMAHSHLRDFSVKTISIANAVAYVLRSEFPGHKVDLKISHNKRNIRGRRTPIHATSLLYYYDDDAMKEFIKARIKTQTPRIGSQTPTVKCTLELEIEQLE